MSSPTINVGVKADQASFRPVETSLKSLISTVDKLNSSLSNVGKTVSNINTGGKQGVVDIKQQMSGKSKGIVGSILGGDDASSMNRMTQSVDQAFSKIEGRIKSFVSSVSSQIRGLNGAIGSISVPVGGATSTTGSGFSGYSYNYGGGARIGGGGGGGGGIIPPTPTPPAIPSGKSSLPSSASMGWQERAAGALLGGATGSLFGGMGGPLGAAIGATTDGMFGGASKLLAPAMGPIGIALAGVGLYNKVATSWEDVRLGRSEYTVQKPFMEYSAMGATASPFASLYHAATGGGVGHVWATHQVLSDEKIRKSMADEKARTEIIGLQTKMTGYSARNIMARGGSSLQATVADVVSSAPTMALSSFGLPMQAPGAIKAMPKLGMSDVEQKTLKEIEYNQAILATPAKQTGELAGAVEARKITNARFNDLAEDIYNNSLSRHRAMIGMGSSTGTMKIKDASGNKIEVDKYWYTVAKLNERGWTEGDSAAGYGTLKDIGLGYGSQLGKTQSVSLGIAGLTNAGQLVKMGGMLGGGVGFGGNFLDNVVQRSIGRRGLDVAVGREMFGSMSSSLFNTGAFVGGGDTAASYMGSAAAFVGGGMGKGGVAFDVSQQQVRMTALTQGMQIANEYGSGRAAGLYQVGNILSGVRAAGGFGIESEIYSGAPAELFTGILRNKNIKTDADLPIGLRESGITLEGIRARSKDILNAPFLNMPNLMSASGKDTEASALMREMNQAAIGGGSAMDPIKTRLAGKKGKDFWRELSRLSTIGGLGISAQGKGISALGGKGLIEAGILQDTDFTASISGSGVGTAGLKGAEKAAQEAKTAIMLSKAIESATGEAKERYQAAFNLMPAAAQEAANRLTEIGKADFGSLDGIVKGLNSHLSHFAEWVKNNAGAMSNNSKAKTAAPQKSK